MELGRKTSCLGSNLKIIYIELEPEYKLFGSDFIKGLKLNTISSYNYAIQRQKAQIVIYLRAKAHFSI